MPTEANNKAQKAARIYLQMSGFELIEQGWSLSRNKIDFIAKKANVIHFIEMRFNPSNKLDEQAYAITETQLKNKQRAAYAWLDESKWSGEFTFSSIELASPGYVVISFLENV